MGRHAINPDKGPMTPAERKRRSRAAGMSYDIRLQGKSVQRMQEFCDRLNMTPSEVVSDLLFSVQLPRKS